uniref:Uncharacterized protein n=1 Tax=Cucumis sativus TaxID=3659 RepID=A0A0A0KTV3_CUCSA
MLIMKKHNHETKLSGCMLISNRLSIVQIKSYGAALYGRRNSYGLLSIESFSGFFGENGVDAFLGTLPISLIIIWIELGESKTAFITFIDPKALEIVFLLLLVAEGEILELKSLLALPNSNALDTLTREPAVLRRFWRYPRNPIHVVTVFSSLVNSSTVVYFGNDVRQHVGMLHLQPLPAIGGLHQLEQPKKIKPFWLVSGGIDVNPFGLD